MARIRSKGWAVGLTGVTVVVILLLFGAMSASSADPSLAQARAGQVDAFVRTPLPSSTPVPTMTFTATPGPGTPTAVSRSACPTAGCPYTLTPTGNWQVDQIWYGQTPPGGGTNKPVLLFVHGLTGIASDWWKDTAYSGVNDMYLTAYNAGYRTAFVSLDNGGGRGPDTNQWTNGPILVTMIHQVLLYYGVTKLDIIAHSKGGVDAQDALWENGYYKYVDYLFTLSSPNQGSQLATLYCTPTGNTISAMCGLDINEMLGVFRPTTDREIALHPITGIYTSGGTDHGPVGSILNLGGKILNNYGSNDGFVTEASAVTLPGSQYMFVRSVNHDSIRVGHNAFPFIQSILEAGTPVAATPPAG